MTSSFSFSKKGSSKTTKRVLGMESLESREMLSVNPLGYDGDVQYAAAMVATENVQVEAETDVTVTATGGVNTATVNVTKPDAPGTSTDTGSTTNLDLYKIVGGTWTKIANTEVKVTDAGDETTEIVWEFTGTDWINGSGGVDKTITLNTLTAGAYSFALSADGNIAYANGTSAEVEVTDPLVEAEKIDSTSTTPATDGTSATGKITVALKDLKNDKTYTLTASDGTNTYSSGDISGATNADQTIDIENVKAGTYTVTLTLKGETDALATESGVIVADGSQQAAGVPAVQIPLAKDLVVADDATTAGKVKLTYTSTNSITGNVNFWYQALGGTLTKVSPANATDKMVDVTLTAGTAYAFYVEVLDATDGSAIGGISETKYFTTKAAPVAPGGVSTEADALTTGKWEKASDITSNSFKLKIPTASKGTADSYEIKFTGTNGNTSTFIVAAADAGKTLEFKGLQSKTKYDISIKAKAAAGGTDGAEVKTTVTTTELKASTGKASNMNIFGATIAVTDKDTKSGVAAKDRVYYVEIVDLGTAKTKDLEGKDWAEMAGYAAYKCGGPLDTKTVAAISFTGLQGSKTYAFRIVEIIEVGSEGTFKDIGGAVQSVTSKVASFKTPATPTPSIAKSGFALGWTPNANGDYYTTLGAQFTLKEPALKTLPLEDPSAAKGTQSSSAPAKYELIVSTADDKALKKGDITGDLAVADIGLLANGLNLGMLNELFGDSMLEHYITDSDEVKKGYNVESIPIDFILTKMFESGKFEEKFLAADAKVFSAAFKALQFQIKVTYTDPSTLGEEEQNTVYAYSKINKLALPKFLTPSFQDEMKKLTEDGPIAPGKIQKNSANSGGDLENTVTQVTVDVSELDTENFTYRVGFTEDQVVYQFKDVTGNGSVTIDNLTLTTDSTVMVKIFGKSIAGGLTAEWTDVDFPVIWSVVDPVI